MLPCSASSRFEACNRGFRLKQVLGGFDEQHVDAAFDQTLDLLIVGVDHGVEGDVSERGQLRRWPHRACDEARLIFRRELLCDFLRDFGGCDVDFGDFVLQVVFREHDASGPESIGLDHVAADFEKVRMDILDDVWTAENQEFVAAFLAPEIVRTEGLRN